MTSVLSTINKASSLFSEQNVRRFFIGHITSLAGNAMLPVALTFAVLDSGHGAADVGLVLGSQSIPPLILMLVGGVLADRISHKRVIVAADSSCCLIEVVFSVVMWSSGASVSSFVFFWVLMGIFGSFSGPAFAGLIPQIVEPGRLQDLNALRGLALSIGTLVGPALSGVLVSLVGASVVIMLDG